MLIIAVKKMNSNAQYNSNLSNDLNEYCFYITKLCKTKKDYENFSGSQFGAFKTHHKNAYNNLSNHLDEQLKLSSFYADLVIFSSKIETKQIIGSILKLIEDLVKFKPNFAKKGIPNNTQISKLQQLIKSSKSNYDNCSGIISQFESQRSDIVLGSPLITSIVNDTNINKDSATTANQQQQKTDTTTSITSSNETDSESHLPLQNIEQQQQQPQNSNSNSTTNTNQTNINLQKTEQDTNLNDHLLKKIRYALNEF